MKNLRLLPIILMPLCLASCGGNSYAGTYAFQLGKTSGTHFGVTASVLEDKYIDNPGTPEEKMLGYHINIKFDMGGAAASGTILDELGLDNLLVPAYYNIGEKAENGDDEIKIGFKIKDLINEEIRKQYPEIEDFLPTIEPQQTEKVIYSTINSSSMTFYIPVGGDDLLFQLYWYGIDVCKVDGEYEIRESTSHKIGTHPTKEEIDAVNNANYKDSHEGRTFRDYHTLTLKLTKQ